MKAQAIAALLLTGAAITGVVLQPDAEAPSEQLEAVSEAPARVKPPQAYAATVVATAEDCPGVTVAQGAEMICIADAAATVASSAPEMSKRKRLFVCPATGEGETARPIHLEWAEPKAACKDGVLIGTPAVKVAMGIETDLTEAMREACKPCPVSPMSWGRCPACILEPGGCAAACPVEVETTETEVSHGHK